MTRVLLTMVLALGVSLATAQAQDAKKKAPAKKPAAEKKVKPEKKKLTPEQRKAAMTKVFEKMDADKDGKLTVDELKGKRKNPKAAEMAEKRIKAKDKNGDGTLSLEEFTSAAKRPAKKPGEKKAGAKKAGAEKPCPKKAAEKKPCPKKAAEKKPAEKK